MLASPGRGLEGVRLGAQCRVGVCVRRGLRIFRRRREVCLHADSRHVAGVHGAPGHATPRRHGRARAFPINAPFHASHRGQRIRLQAGDGNRLAADSLGCHHDSCPLPPLDESRKRPRRRENCDCRRTFFGAHRQHRTSSTPYPGAACCIAQI